jgi:hypothetical protein
MYASDLKKLRDEQRTMVHEMKCCFIARIEAAVELSCHRLRRDSNAEGFYLDRKSIEGVFTLSDDMTFDQTVTRISTVVKAAKEYCTKYKIVSDKPDQTFAEEMNRCWRLTHSTIEAAAK